jgi:hypothetical protein
MLAFVHKIITERHRHRQTTDGDRLNLMFNTVDPKTGEALSLDNVTDQVTTLPIAGHETTAAFVEVALRDLACGCGPLSIGALGNLGPTIEPGDDDSAAIRRTCVILQPAVGSDEVTTRARVRAHTPT